MLYLHPSVAQQGVADVVLSDCIDAGRVSILCI